MPIEDMVNAGYIVGALAIAAPLYVMLAYNGLVRARNMLQEGWSGIDVQLRRRADLVPNLIETVKGYAAHEHGIFEDLADKRAQSLAANSVTGQIAAEQAMQGALGRLFAVAEAYPVIVLAARLCARLSAKSSKMPCSCAA